MSEMRAAVFANNLAPNHAVTRIRYRAHSISRHRQPKTWPAGSGVVFMLRTEQSRVATDTTVAAVRLVIDVFTGKRTFRSFVLGNLELFVIQFRAQFFVVRIVHYRPRCRYSVNNRSYVARIPPDLEVETLPPAARDPEQYSTTQRIARHLAPPASASPADAQH